MTQVSIRSNSPEQTGSSVTVARRLELARPLLRPAFYHNFLFGVELDGVAPLAMHDSQETVLPTAEWKVGHRCGHSDVDTNIPRLDLVAELAGGRSAAGKDRGCIAIKTFR